MLNLIVFVFLVIFAVLLIAVAVGFSATETQRKKQVASVLTTVNNAPATSGPRVIIERPNEKHIIDELLALANLTAKIQRLLSQAGSDWGTDKFLVATAIAAGVGALIGLKFNPLGVSVLSAAVTAGPVAMLPYAAMSHKRKKRLGEFEEQFPEALDFLARSMRAGHAFSTSLEMLGSETPDPLGREFRILFNEQSFGADLESALWAMTERVPLVDTRFFVSAVMLQRQTGGNLSEILGRLAYVIRERFRLRGQVKAATAHGRMTAMILTFIPIILVVALMFIAPTYLRMLATDPDGRYLILAAIGAQILGYLWIKKIINIKI
jgi:tight adherence protein B